MFDSLTASDKQAPHLVADCSQPGLNTVDLLKTEMLDSRSSSSLTEKSSSLPNFSLADNSVVTSEPKIIKLERLNPPKNYLWPSRNSSQGDAGDNELRRPD